MASIVERISTELSAKPWQVEAAVALLDQGSTVPFIARYRKEATGQLDDTQLRHLEERLRYLRELEERRKAILESIEAQGKLDDALRATIMDADNKARLEDIYLPFKPKRRTKAQIAIEAGLAPLAEALLGHPEREPKAQAEPFVNAEKNVADADRRARGRARHSRRAFRRRRRSHRPPARDLLDAGADEIESCAPARRRRARNSPIISISPSRW